MKRAGVASCLLLSVTGCGPTVTDDVRPMAPGGADRTVRDGVSGFEAVTPADPGMPEVACEGVVRSATSTSLGNGSGTLRIPLVLEARSGTRYRLQGATFALQRSLGAEEFSQPEYPSVLTVEAGSELDSLDAVLPSGDYTVSLAEGWRLEQVGAGGGLLVPAALLSPVTKSVDIGAGLDTPLRLRFEVSLPGSEFAPAAIAPSLDVLERPQPLSGRVCVESSVAPEAYAVSSQEALNALEGCYEVGGGLELEVNEPLDLAPLRDLHRVCGRFSVYVALTSPDLPLPEQSLAGLEALEEVDAFRLSHPGVVSLAPLGSLRRVQRPDIEDEPYGLFIDAASLDDLAGLENVTEIRNFGIGDGARVASLRGLTLPAEMTSVGVYGESLSDLSALSNVTRISKALRIANTSVESLSALSNLRDVNDLGIFSNLRLIDASGLGSLEVLGYALIYDSPSLEALPVFSSLARLGQLSISLPALRGTLAFPRLGEAGSLELEENAQLESISLPALTKISSLTVRRNASLESLELGALEHVIKVDIVGNPALDVRTLPDVMSLGATATKIERNAGDQSVPLDPCPWVNDGECDQGFYGAELCAPGSDVVDCNHAL